MRNPSSIPARAVGILAALCLAVALVGAGFAACAVPDITTQLLSQATSNDTASPFDRDELVHAAVATKDYTVGSHDLDAVERAIGDINRTANTPYAHSDDILSAPEEYTLPPSAISHLDDVYSVVSTALRVVAGIAIAGIALVIAGGFIGGSRCVGGALIGGGAIVLACFIALGAWAALDFSSLFTALHSLFFTEGTWMFSYDSLLICMYPTAFWMGMGAVWLVVTALLSVVAIALGAKTRRR